MARSGPHPSEGIPPASTRKPYRIRPTDGTIITHGSGGTRNPQCPDMEKKLSRPEALRRLQVLHAVPDFLGEFFNLLGFLNAGNRHDIFIRFAYFFLERG